MLPAWMLVAITLRVDFGKDALTPLRCYHRWLTTDNLDTKKGCPICDTKCFQRSVAAGFVAQTLEYADEGEPGEVP